MKTDIYICTLGKLSVERGGEIVENFVSTKAVLLLVYLAMHPGEHPRKKLASTLWSETSDEQALKNLRTVLSSLRQQVNDALVIEHDMLAINSGISITVDAMRFESGCAQVFSASAASDSLRFMQELAQLYQGDFLEGIAIRDAEQLDTWVSEKQRQLQHLYMRLLSEITETAYKQASYETGLQYAWKLVHLDPLWDAAQRQLMRLLLHTNRANEALLQYERFSRLLEDELQTVPDDETRALVEQIRSRQIGSPKAKTRASIAVSDMPFVEPVEDIEIAQRMLNTPQCRLLTIFGISGIGKTALATQIAFHRQHLYRDGAYFISLKHSQSARDLPYLIAAALELDFTNQTDYHTLETILLNHLKSRSVLLVLDNYEYLLPETSFIHSLLDSAAQVQVIIASQSPLNLFREWLLPLRGLRVPSPDDSDPETYEAIRLFEVTAQRINPRFNLRANLAGVTQICRLVDGLPLAIVIAAGWTQILPIHKIIEHISEGQEFNLPFQQTLQPHHQSLEMMLEYTWNTLSVPEQQALTALSIFNSTFELDEAEHICGVDMFVLTTLIHRSLIQKFDDKYRMHQMVWRYARKRLLYSDQREALGHQYLAYYEQMFQQLAEQKLPLHEYLLAVEMQYASIWNYDWMVKSFQPVYMLSISRFLIVYWEVSRIDVIPQIEDFFKTLQPLELPPAMRVLLNVQLARMNLQDSHTEQVDSYLLAALRDDIADISWSDLFSLYYVCAMSFLLKSHSPQEAGDNSLELEDETYIIRRSNLKLTTLFLAIGDQASADAVLVYLSENTSHPTDCAIVRAMRGAVAADYHDLTTALNQFSYAVQCLEDTDESLLAASLNAVLMRLAANRSSAV